MLHDQCPVHPLHTLIPSHKLGIFQALPSIRSTSHHISKPTLPMAFSPHTVSNYPLHLPIRWPCPIIHNTLAPTPTP
jgi:hypothetical protein